MTVRAYILGIWALLLAACAGGGSDEVVPVPTPGESGAVVFGSAVTRAALEEQYTSFYVKAVKTMGDNAKQVVMPGYEVRYDDTKRWYYDGVNGQSLKYWDLVAKSYVFAAVAPTTSTATITDAGEITLSLADLSVDWMVARTIRTMATPADRDDMDASHQFPALNSQFAEVPLNFHRILAKVVFKAYADGEVEIDPLEVDFTNIACAPATYGTARGWVSTAKQTAQEVYNEKTTITSTNNDRDHALPLTSLYVVPQQLEGTPGVKIKVKQNNNDAETVMLNIPGSWEPNKIYTYYLKFDAFDPTEVILFDVVVDPWEWKEETEDEQHNW